jgi:uncharacterized membrane protein
MIFRKHGKSEANSRPAFNRTAYTVLLLFSFLWSGGVLVSPILYSHGHPAGGAVAHLLYAPVCHQNPARSFTICRHPLAVCERCSALYFSFTIFVLAYPLIMRRSRSGISLTLLLLFLLPLAMDRGLAILGILHNTMITRTLTGIFAGAGLALYVVPAWLRAWDEKFGFAPPKHRQIKEVFS